MAVICVTLLQCVLSWAHFAFNNEYGHSSSFLIYSNIIVEVARSTFSRDVILLVSLGYGILIRSIERYQTKILTLTFLYMISLAAELSIAYINHFSPVSGAIIFVVLIPNFGLNFCFNFWIYLALRRTLNYL